MLRACLAIIGTFVYVALAASAASAQASGYKVLYTFQGIERGAHPRAGVIAADGKLYGTTSIGGAYNTCPTRCGTVFSVNRKSGVERVRHSFQGGSDGDEPLDGLLDVDGVLYGTTRYGGLTSCNGDCGLVFSLDPKTGVERVVYSFQGSSDGYLPYGSLVNGGGLLYGSTAAGGVYNFGTVFSVDPATGAEQVVYNFKQTDAASPTSLIKRGNVLYGTTNGGSSKAGTIFSLNLATGIEQVLYTFKGRPDGDTPNVLTEVDGLLYGTTSLGGSSGRGTVFSLDPRTGIEDILYSFKGSTDGREPAGGLVNLLGTFYGTTLFGGASNGGTLFSLNPATGVETILYSFQGNADGNEPFGSLIGISGTLYGTTNEGGGSGANGVVFSFLP